MKNLPTTRASGPWQARLAEVMVLDGKTIRRFAVLISLAIIVPALGFSQEITGPLVNALLILSVDATGLGGAILVGGVPSLLALARGTLPAPLAVMIPYIIAGNATLVAAYWLLRRRNYWLALAVGASLKFLLLAFAVSYAVSVPPSLRLMMQWPQLLTALLGGVIAWVLSRTYQNALRALLARWLPWLGL